jgi:O-antigen ligase
MTFKNSVPYYLIGLYPLALIFGTLVSEIITLFLIIFFIIDCVNKKKIFFIKDPIIYFLIIIWIYMLFNLFNSIDFNMSLNRSIFFFRYPLLIISIVYFLTMYPNKIGIIFKLWMITIIITILDLYIQFFFGENILGYKSPWSQRLSGFFDQELKVAHLLIGFFLPAFSFFFQKKPKNILLYIILILYFVILILTNERANIIRGILALLIFFIFIPNFKIKIKIISTSLILGIFCLMIFFVQPVKNRFLVEISSMKAGKSISNYIILSNYGPHYLTSFEIFKKNKLLGTGTKTFRISCWDFSIKKYYKDAYSSPGAGCSNHPHQYYFEILSELGLIGFLIFLSFFIFLSFKIIKNFYVSQNLVLLSSGSFLIVQFMPLIPTGSFFTSFGSTIFFINVSLIFINLNKDG